MMKSPCICRPALLLIFILSGLHGSGLSAQDNRWTGTSGGKWEDGTKWNLGIPPNINHNVVIANGGSRSPSFGVVLVDATSAALPGNMVVSNLRVGSGPGLVLGVDVLTLNNAGMATPLTVLSSAVITNYGTVNITGSILTINNTLAVSSGNLTLNSGAVLNVKGNNMPAYDFIVDGTLTMKGGLLNFSNSFPIGMVIGRSGVGTMTMSGGTFGLGNSAYLMLGAAPGAVGSLIVTGGVARLEGQFFSIGDGTNSSGMMFLNGGELITGDCYIGDHGAGRLIVSNGIWRATPPNAVWIGRSYGADGRLVLAGGTNLISGRLAVGNLLNVSTGSLAIVGGELTITNVTSIFDHAAISNGMWRATDVLVTRLGGAPAELFFAGGSTLISSSLKIGDQFNDELGRATVLGGTLTITNASTNATLTVGNGTFRLEGGTVVVDTIDLTRTTARFERTGGTLLYRTALLDPLRDDDGDGATSGLEQAVGLDPLDPSDGMTDTDGDGVSDTVEYLSGTDYLNSNSVVKIISILPQGDDIRLRWKTVGGKTNIIQAAATIDAASNFVDVASIVISGSGDKTNIFIEPEGAIQGASRFYRVKIIP